MLTGDWLAELTMLILARQRMRHGAGSGYARTFLTQMKQVLGTCLERDIKVVTNAGGLDPQGCADALAELAETLGLAPVIAVVTGDNVLELIGSRPQEFPNLDTGEALGARAPITANAYLGGEPVTAALARRGGRGDHRAHHRCRARDRARGLVARLVLRRRGGR